MTRGLAPFVAAVAAAALACAQEIEEPDDADLGELYFGSGDHVTANGLQRMHVAANQIVLDPVRRAAFISQSLPTTLADGTLEFDPFTSTFLRYVAQCALEPGQALTYYNETFHGALGLCTSWYDEAPSSRCREAVSGCLLGLNNKLGVRVPVSPRGQPGGRRRLPLGGRANPGRLDAAGGVRLPAAHRQLRPLVRRPRRRRQSELQLAPGAGLDRRLRVRGAAGSARPGRGRRRRRASTAAARSAPPPATRSCACAAA